MAPITSETWLVAILLWIVPNIVGILPRFVQMKKYPHAFTFLGCISAGVFLSLLLCHVVPEICEERPSADGFFDVVDHQHSTINYGLFLSGMVFLVFLVVDGVIGHSMIDMHDHAHGHHHHHHEDCKEEDELQKEPGNKSNESVSKVRAVVFVSIVSLHSLLEGLMEIHLKTQFPALLIHKALEIFAIGSALMRINCSTVMYVGLVSFSAVLTSAAHLIFSLASKSEHGTAFSILNGLSLGAIVYATFGECIPHEMEKESPSVGYRIGYIMSGYLASTLISMLISKIHFH